MTFLPIVLLALSMSSDAFAAAIGKGARLDRPSLGEALRTGRRAFASDVETCPYIAGKPGLAANNRRVNVYHLTPAGRRLLARQVENWNRFTGAVGLILSMA